MTYGKAISMLESETQKTVEASLMLEAIDKILSMATIITVNKNALMNAVRFLRNHVNELLKEREAQPAIIENFDVFRIGRCPSCKTRLQPWGANYCHKCGQAVKWDG